MPSERLNSIKALVRVRIFLPVFIDVAGKQNFGGRYGGAELLVESDTGTRAIQTKVTPNLAKLTNGMQNGLEYALAHDMPVLEGIDGHCFDLGD